MMPSDIGAETEVGADTLFGVEEIAAFLRVTRRRAYYLCETREIPSFKLGGRWHLRRSTYLRHVEHLERVGTSE